MGVATGPQWQTTRPLRSSTTFLATRVVTIAKRLNLWLCEIRETRLQVECACPLPFSFCFCVSVCAMSQHIGLYSFCSQCLTCLLTTVVWLLWHCRVSDC